MNENNYVLTPEEASKILRISLPTMYKMVKAPDFPSIQCGRRIVIPKDKFLAWIDKKSAEKAVIED